MDRFQLGSGILRGFEPGGIGPREYDSVRGVNDALGGDKFAAMRLEALFPIGLPEEYGITGACSMMLEISGDWNMTQLIFNMKRRLAASSGRIDHLDNPSWTFRFNFSRAIAKNFWTQRMILS